MKPISLEGLRRLMRGGSRDKDRQDSHHFRRSNSFKRASIRKSTRRQEKITLPNGLVVKTTAVQRKSSVSSDERCDDGYSTDGGEAGGGCGGSSSGVHHPPKRVISYDEWVATMSDEETFGPAPGDSQPSTLSTNKLSSLDSGVRHSLDSKKKLSVDSAKRLSLDSKKKLSVDSGRQLSVDSNLKRGLEAPIRRSMESTFRRSVSTESPLPQLRIKNLLGSPKVAPKHREPGGPQCPGTPGSLSYYSVHNTPSRSRVLGNVGTQPLSAPPTPGKQQQMYRINAPQTPSRTFRSSFHERERFCAVHGPYGHGSSTVGPPPLSAGLPRAPGSPQVSNDRKAAEAAAVAAAGTSSPKPQGRWSSMFSTGIFSRSPSRKNQHQLQLQQQQQQQQQQLQMQQQQLQLQHQQQLQQQQYQQQQHYQQQQQYQQFQQQQKFQQQQQQQMYQQQQQQQKFQQQQQQQQASQSPHLIRQRSVQSASGLDSPCPVRHHPRITSSSGSNTTGPSSLGGLYGVARAQGGCRKPPPPPLEEPGPRSLGGHPGYHSPHVLQRQFSQPANPTMSPAPLHRQLSIPPTVFHSSPAFRQRPISSPPPTHSPKALQILGESPNVVQASQFYPGKVNGAGMIGVLPPVTVIAGVPSSRPASNDRISSRNSSQERGPPQRQVSSERPRTPSAAARHAIQPPNFVDPRPQSLIFERTIPAQFDPTSPVSQTSETSSKLGKKKKGPSLLVGKVSWLSRSSSSRKSARLMRRAKKVSRRGSSTSPIYQDDLDDGIPTPPRPARLGPEVYQVMKDRPKSPPVLSIEDPMMFIPPQRRRSSGNIKVPTASLLRRVEVPEIRTAHAHLLMPLNKPVGSQTTGGRTQFVKNMLEGPEEDNVDGGDGGVKDTTSEPGGSKFSVLPRGGGGGSGEGGKPKSEPGTARLNVKISKNPEVLLKALGFDPLRLNKAKASQSQDPVDAVNERVVTQLLLKQLLQSESMKSDLPIVSASRVGSKTGSVESLVSSRASSKGSGRHGRRVRRRKSVKKQPAVPAYPSWKRTKPKARTPKPNGDITQKGYEKKRNRLLQPFLTKEQSQGAPARESGVSPSTRSRRRAQRRVTRNESRYHSEVRQEAVKEALAQYQSRPKNLPLPSKRSSVMTTRSPDRQHHDSDSEDSDEDSVTAEGSVGSGGGSQGTPEVSRPPLLLPPPQPQQPALQQGPSPPHSHHTPPLHLPQLPLPPKQQQQPLPPVPPHNAHSTSSSSGSRLSNGEEDPRRRDVTEVTDLMRNISTYSQPPDVTNNTRGSNNRVQRDDRITRYTPSQGRAHSQSETENWRGTGRWKVSNKIQQLLNTLKRPKRRPLPEFYVDDEEDLEIAANPKDPNAPKPEGMIMTPARGEQLMIPSGLPRSVEDAVYRYGSSSGYKAPVATILDANGKLSVSLTYGKLLSRSQKMAYNLLTRLGGRGEGTVMPGDRVALVYPNNDPVSFMCAFYACLQAGLVPVPIEVPISRRDAGSQQIGFLLGSCGVQVALTSEACFKGLPKTSAGEVVSFKGWPKLTWFITDHLQKPPKDWQPPPRLMDDSPAYIEYTTDKDGAVKGVVVTRTAMLSHCRTLTSSCNYTEGEVAVCVLDFKREVGLWHAMLCSVFNGMHIIFIPYSVMKVNPASWMHMITRFKASIAIVKSRDLHWGLLATKDHKDVNLQSLRLLLVADGANPWSLSSCDQFLAVFQTKGLRPDAICPCASSPEALTVSVRRPGHGGANAVGRGVLSMHGLSYGVVRVDQENSLTSLTLQDCGQVLPGSMIVVVKMDGAPYVCRTDEVGEICVAGTAVGAQYWGLQGLTNTTFHLQPLLPDNTPISENTHYVRTGLLGFLGPGGLVFVCGSRDGLMTVTARKHNTDDIIATVLAVEPMKFIYRGRIAVFSHKVLRDERICVIAEQRPDCSEEESFQWMSRVLQAVDSIHQVGIYCLALVPPNHLPKTPLGGIHLSETKKKFLEGSLHPANVLMCPHTCVTNLPKPREVHHDVGPASVMVGNLVQGNRLAMAQGRDIGLLDDEDASRRHPQFIADILKWRAHTTEGHEILTLLNSKGQVAVSLTCSQLHKKAERVGVLLLEKGHINTGDHVALIYPPGVDLIAAFYGCLYVGAVPVTIRPPHPQNLTSTLNTVRTVVDVSKSSIILSTLTVVKLLKSKEEKIDTGKKWPPILDTDDLPKKRLPSIYKPPTPEMIAYLDFSVSTTGMLAGIKMSHAGATALCLSMKVACELYPSRVVALCLDPYCGLGLALWVLSSVYSGHQSILIPPGEVEVNPALWLSAVSQHKVRDTFCSYGVMELCTKGLGSSIAALKARAVNLACVRTCVVVAEERPRIQLTNSFSKLFSGLGLSPRAVSTSFGCRVNVAICLQGASSPDPSTVFLDLRSLRHDRVTLVERGAPHSLCLMESGKLLPGCKVVIANPDTKGQCSDSHLGEIWVQSPHTASGYFTVYGDDGTSGDHFNAQLVTGATGEVYARTGYLGFLRRTESVQADGELHDAVFVVGSLDETVMLRGMRYHPIDIEMTVMRCHKKVAECAVFTWTNLLVVVVELDGAEYEALDLVPLITSAVLEEHQLITGVIVVVDPGVVPINSRGEKQRMHLRDGFLADQLDPIYVAYNM